MEAARAIRSSFGQPSARPARRAGPAQTGARRAPIVMVPPAVVLSPAAPSASPASLPAGVARLLNSPGSGQPLPAAIQDTLERRLEVPLRSVRLHMDASAAAAARSLGARAFTYGLHVFLGEGEQATDLPLMAHEVAHVVQQAGAPVLQTYSEGGIDRFEREAHQTAATVTQGGRSQVQERTGGARVQTIPIIDDVLEWVEDNWS